WGLGGVHRGAALAWAGAAGELAGVAVPVAQGAVHPERVHAAGPGRGGLAGHRAVPASAGGSGVSQSAVVRDLAGWGLGVEGAAAGSDAADGGRRAAAAAGADPAEPAGPVDRHARDLWAGARRGAGHAGDRTGAAGGPLASARAGQSARAAAAG